MFGNNGWIIEAKIKDGIPGEFEMVIKEVVL